jgi:hypothetical protein
MPTYSFKEVGAAIDGPGGNISIGAGSGVAEEGITIERTEDSNTMAIGADGEVMHSLHAGDSGQVRARFLKTSPTNARLQAMWNYQRTTGANHGRNTITLRDFQRGDIVTCTEVAFTGNPSLTWSKAGQMVEWHFHAGHVDPVLGYGVPATEGVA